MTYEEFTKEAGNAGLYDRISAANYKKYEDRQKDIRAILENSAATVYNFHTENKDYLADAQEVEKIYLDLKKITADKIENIIAGTTVQTAKEALRSATMNDAGYSGRKAYSTLEAINKYCKGLPPKHMATYLSAIKKLGEIWNRVNVKSLDLEAMLDTTTLGKLKLGTYGVDNMSCWRGGEARQLFAASKNTFILIFREKDKKNNMARLIGKYDPDKEIVFFHNFYYAPKTHEGTIIEGLRFIASKILNKPQENLVCLNKMLKQERGSTIWINVYLQWAFMDKAQKAKYAKMEPIDIYAGSNQ